MTNQTTAKVIKLGARDNMTPIEALEMSRREDWEDVLIAGYQDGELVIRSSKMTRRDALWIAEQVKRHLLGDLD